MSKNLRAWRGRAAVLRVVSSDTDCDPTTPVPNSKDINMTRAISGVLALRWLRRHCPSTTVTRTGADRHH
jgi:hypothetical protein